MKNQELRQRVLAAFQDGPVELGESFTFEGPIHDRPYSQIFLAKMANTEFPLAAKIFLNPYSGTPDFKLARSQFDALRRTAEAMGTDKKYRVPRVVHLLEDDAIVVMEWVTGESLQEHLLDWRYKTASLADDAREAGHWLRCFHDAGALPPGRLGAARLLAELQDYVRSHAPYLEKDSALVSATNVLRSACKRVDDRDLRRSCMHSDFHPANILFSRDCVFGLDFGPYREDVYLHDVINFINYLDHFLTLPKGWRLRPHRRAIEQAFLRGYSSEGIATDHLHLQWLRLWYSLRFLARFYREGPTALHDWYFRLCACKQISVLTNMLGKEIEA